MPTYDNSSGAGSGAAPSLRWDHAVTASGGNRCLLLWVASRGGVTASNATYGLQKFLVAGPKKTDTDIWSQLWYLIDPEPGTSSISVKFAAGNPTISALAMSFTDVKQTGGIYTLVTDAGAADPISQLSVTTSATNDLVCDVITSRLGANFTAAAGQTKRLEQDSASITQAASTANTTSTPSTTLDWTWNANTDWVHIAVSLLHAAYTPAVVRTKDITHHMPRNRRRGGRG